MKPAVLIIPKNNPKKVCIIGAGFAGIAASIFCDNLGLKVDLIERKPILGGRTYAFKDQKTGHWIDNGQHLLMGAYTETMKLIENLGTTRFIKPQKKTSVPLINEKFEKISFKAPFFDSILPSSLSLLLALLKMKGFSLKEKINFIKFGIHLQKIKNRLDDSFLTQSVDNWLTRLNQSEFVKKNFWEILTLATLNETPSKASARMLAVVLCKGLMGGKKESQLILPKGNLNDLLATPSQKYLEMRGQNIHFSSRVKKIHILDSEVKTIELNDGKIIKADYFISATPPDALLQMIPQGYVDTIDYFSKIKELKFSPIVSINLWFDQQIMEDEFTGLASENIHWIFNKNKMEGDFYPPFHYMVVISGALKFLDKSREEIINLVLEELKKFFPKINQAQLVHSLVNKEKQATISADVASEKYRVSQKSPLKNFYVIGDWTNTGFPPTIESAVISAKMAVDDIKKNLGIN